MYLWCHFGVGGYCFSFFLILLINGCLVKLDPKIIWIWNVSNYSRFGETAMLIYFHMYFPWSKFWIWHDFTQKNCKWAASLGKDGMRSSWLKACLSLGPSDPVVGLMPWAGFEGWYTLLLYNLYNPTTIWAGFLPIGGISHQLMGLSGNMLFSMIKIWGDAYCHTHLYI